MEFSLFFKKKIVNYIFFRNFEKLIMMI